MEKVKRWHVLSKIVKEFDLKIGVEVGAKAGENIRNVLLRCPDFTFIGVDHWDPKIKYQTWSPKVQPVNEKKFDLVCKEFPERTKKMKYLSDVAADFFENESLDLVFIDASHDAENVYNDIEKWYPKVRSGGFICGHDFGHPKIGNVEAGVKRFFNDDIALFEDYVWAVKK
jgi:hypothetical protein